jgi:RNA processing factor Prp31
MDPEDVKQIKEWEREAGQFAKTRDEVTSYINYKIDTEW